MNDCTNAGRLQAQAADRFRKIITDITIERARQDSKWGEQNHDYPSWLPILQEEMGEASRSFLKATFTAVEAEGARREGKPVDTTPATAHAANFRKELIETAAVVLAMLECGERNGWWPR
jgi:hypothetical protein